MCDRRTHARWLCRLYCTAHTVLHILYCTYCTAHTALHILHCTYCTAYTVLDILYCTYCTAHTVLHILHCTYCTAHTVLHILYFCSEMPYRLTLCSYSKVLCAFFWVIPRRLNFIFRSFGTFCMFHLHRQVGACRILHASTCL